MGDLAALVATPWQHWEPERGPCLAVPFPLSNAPAPMHDAGWALLRTLAAQAPVERVLLAGLIATQAGVAAATLRAFVTCPLLDPPLVIRWRGCLYINDGHHRAVAAWLRGEPTILAHVLDLDALSVV